MRAKAAWALAGLVLWLFAAPAPAHIVMGGTSLQTLTRDADVVALVRVVEPAAVLEAKQGEKPFRTLYVRAEVLETWKGEPPAPKDQELRFYQHGHAVVEYAAGEQVVVFLRRSGKVDELARGPIPESFAWVSEQESDARFPVDATNRRALADAVASYLAVQAEPPATRADRLRRLTVELLASPVPVLARSAMHDLVMAGERIALSQDDLPVLLPLVDGSEEGGPPPIGIRIGLLAELERRGLLAGSDRWVRLIEQTRGQDKLAVVRAAAANPSVGVAKALIPLLENGDLALASTAAVALGPQPSGAATKALARLLDSPESRLRMSAIRGLGRSPDPAARSALESAASNHADPATRRRAKAELRAGRRDAAAHSHGPHEAPHR